MNKDSAKKPTQTKKWILPEKESSDKVKELADNLNIQVGLAGVLFSRGIDNFEKAKTYFRPKLDQLHDPFLMQDMSKAVNRLSEAISSNEKILIYGDYDVDGTTSVAMLYGFLKEFTDQIDFYIPDRYSEGYGISEKGIRWASSNGFKLIIALDCGIRANKMATLSKKLDMDLIVCDHHLPGDELPEAYAILDPKRSDCTYPYKQLSGCGVGFKLISGFSIQNTIDSTILYNYLDLVAVSIASDIVPITGENRVLAYYGLKKLNTEPSPGLKSLIEISGRKNALDISDIVFYIGPRINAAGRLTHAKESVDVLIGLSGEKLNEISKQLNETNKERREFDSNITDEALDMIESNAGLLNAKTTVLFNNNWHKGVIGIVASRCTEHYYRPTIILTESNGKATGSARSVVGFDIHSAITACSHLLEQFGGHSFAAGLTMDLDKIEAFKSKFEKVVSSTIKPDQLIPKVYVDGEVSVDFINFKTLSIIQQMAPFGPENPSPTLLLRNPKLAKKATLVKEEHLKLFLSGNKQVKTLEAIGFGMGQFEQEINAGRPFEILFHIEENNYRGHKSLQLILKDLKFID